MNDLLSPNSRYTQPTLGPSSSSQQLARSDGGGGGQSLADVLERVLDKGVVIAGDVAIKLLDIELLTIKVRLLIASADKAREMGIDWWENDPQLSSKAKKRDAVEGPDQAALQDENKELKRRLEQLESRIEQLGLPAPKGDAEQGARRPRARRKAENGKGR